MQANDQETQELTYLLRALVRDSLHGMNLEQLVGFAVRRTEVVLQWLSYKKNYRFVDLGLEIRDVAYDMVGELFAGADTHCCKQLRAAIQGTDDDSPEALISAFEAILFKNVQQHLARIFGEIDPISQHLLRSLRGHIYHSSDIVTLDRFDGRWYALHGERSPDLAKPAMPIEMLRQSLHLHPMKAVAPIVQYFRSLLYVLRDQDEYRKAIHEGEILTLVRDLLKMQYLAGAETYSNPDDNHDTMALGHVLFEALSTTLPWIEETYLKKNRLSRKEMNCFISAIRVYFNDLMTETETLGPYFYLRKDMPGLTHERFRESYRRKFENILHRVLDEASKRLGKEEIYLK